MSILPHCAQDPTSSSSFVAASQNPNSDDGRNLSLSSPSPSPSQPYQLSFGSLNISDHPPPSSMADQVSGPLAPAAESSRGSSKEVTESGTPNGKKNSPHQFVERHAQSRSAGRRAQSKGKMSGGTVSPGGQQIMGPSNSQGSTLHPHLAGRRAHMINGNHLLNFHYDPIARSQPRGPPPPPPRRQYKIKPYNKDLFLQANYKFVVLDTGNYAPESMDPDTMLRWEDIICLRYSTSFPVQCPICLEYPLCPQITSCGHIFCFPCILQYLMMGGEDHKGDRFKRCPLCFMMMSLKDLYTIYIENVKQYCVGDTIEFMLLTRQRGSFTLSRKNERETGSTSCRKDERKDPFAKFTLTSDVDLSVRQAISDLDSWLVRADSGLVDDIEKLPFVCAAMDQLEQRKKYWNGHRNPENNRCNGDSQMDLLSRASASGADHEECGSGHGTQFADSKGQNKLPGNLKQAKPDGDAGFDKSGNEDQSLEAKETIPTTCNESKDLQRQPTGSGDVKENDSYNFYQAVDGQHIILHPLNMKCLLQHYGCYDMLPHSVRGRILQFETVTQSEAMRKRYRYLSHFSLTTTFQLCEIDLSELLHPDALLPFMDEIKKRERQRKQLAKKERKDKIKAEVAAAAEFVPNFGQSSHGDSPAFSMEDFEALGSSVAISSSPPIVGERKLFSSVTKLGFAAGHDSPALKIEETNGVHNNEGANESAGSRNSGTPSFANVIARQKSVESLDAPKTNEMGKKGKKASRVLLSTAGGRRY